MSEISLDSPQLFGSSPRVIVLGESDLDLTQDILSFQLCYSRARSKILEVSVNNWGVINNTIGFKYSGRPQGNDPIYIGAKIELSFGSFTLAIGNVITLALDFPDGNPPTLSFSVDTHRPRQKAHSDVLTITYGKGLREFHPVLHSGHSTIHASGITDGSPQLIAGVKLKILGVGNVFQGTYSVTESKHTYDMTHGYKTKFVCAKDLP